MIEQASKKYGVLSSDEIERFIGKLLFEEERSDLRATIRNRDGEVLTPEQVQRLAESIFEALRIGRQISTDILSDFGVSCVRIVHGYMSTSCQVDKKLINDQSESQIAACIHEMLEILEQDTLDIQLGSNNEVLPHIAEFLFTGERRLKSYFKWMHDNYYNDQIHDNHDRSWGDVVRFFMPYETQTDPEILWQKLLEKRTLPEPEKIKLVQTAIEQAKATSKKID